MVAEDVNALFNVGDRVQALWGISWHKATISGVCDNGDTYWLTWKDGTWSYVRTGNVRLDRFCIGDVVEAMWGKDWYEAEVSGVNDDDSYWLTWKDDETWSYVSACSVRLKVTREKLFERRTSARIREVLLTQQFGSSAEEFRPARVAIVGAGPTGLWTAVLIGRHCNNKSLPKSQSPYHGGLVPTIDLFERRQHDSACNARGFKLTVGSKTNDLLKRLLWTQDESFSPSCSINHLQQRFLQNFERLQCHGELRFESAVDDPEALFDMGYDVVIVASGRRALSDAWREAHGFELTVRNADMAIIFELKGVRSAGPKGTDAAIAGRLASIAGSRVFVRPGLTSDHAFIWLRGLSADLTQHFERHLESHDPVCTSMSVMWSWLTSDLLNGEDDALPKPPSWISTALSFLDEMMGPSQVTVQLTEAAYWHSANVVRRLQHGWLVLAGDVACGHPFYLGTNLQGHLFHTAELVGDGAPPWLRWDPSGDPFRKYVQKYHSRIAAPGHQQERRRSESASPPSSPTKLEAKAIQDSEQRSPA